MKIHSVEQNTLAWMELHIGLVSASGLGNLMTPEFKRRTGEMAKTYLYRKVAEAWRNQILLGTMGAFDTEQGMVLEEEARPFFELESGKTVRTVGFITNDQNTCGCSPDGLIEGEDCGLEIKCPAAHTHAKYLLEGILPLEYVTQVYGSLYVTGYPRWIFMSYRRKFPPFVIEIERDDEINAKIDDVVEDFCAKLADAKNRMAFLQAGGLGKVKV